MCVRDQVTVADHKEGHLLEVTWQKDHHRATLKADLQGMSFEILATRGKDQGQTKNISYKLGLDDCSEAQEDATRHIPGGPVKWEQQEVCVPA